MSRSERSQKELEGSAYSDGFDAGINHEPQDPPTSRGFVYDTFFEDDREHGVRKSWIDGWVDGRKER